MIRLMFGDCLERIEEVRHTIKYRSAVKYDRVIERS